MMIRCHRFNIYLGVALAVVLASGCRTPEGKRKAALATLQLRQETAPGPISQGEVVTVLRDPLVTLCVGREPFLSDVNVKGAKVIDIVGGFALSIQFDRQGTWLLEQYSGASMGRRIAIFSQFGEPPDYKLNSGRWVGALQMSKRITDGLLIFTPNTTREEAEQIALGLNNVAKKTHSSVTSNW
jgi:hypothetical protein